MKTTLAYLVSAPAMFVSFSRHRKSGGSPARCHVPALAVLLFVSAAGWSSVASAQTNLGAPIISGDCLPSTGGTSTCGYVTEGASDVGGEVSSSVSVNPPTFIFDGSGSVHNTLQFEVLGPTGSSATLQLNASAATSFTGGGDPAAGFTGTGSAEAEVILVNPAVGTPIFDEHACSNVFDGCQLALTPSSGPSLAIVNYTFTVPTNTVYNLATVLFYYDINGATLSASIDPNVTFAPTFNSSGDALIYSADTVLPVTGPAAAPEIDTVSAASSLTLLLGSLLVLRDRRSTKLNSTCLNHYYA